ncbi:LPD7 domain-containing protein [Sphingomonas sp. CARO-RG-8B-R24-01]|uniref:LPD7 domain-containing protein n=1 Tax=Sphingomonas sp. CARO-RG-8B-R24-01 TaxID=2914831 RepID=UPI001F55BB75|nr:LPD7 domain-containing protein [Sphingomonas sp. CARO-RG-8B-R24-01]
MSADNSVARGGLDAQTQAEQAAFQIPPELATRYQVRIIEPSDGSERRVGMFLPTDRENPSIEIAGDRIIARNEDPETVSALVTIAKHNGWAGIDVEGSPEFRQAVWTAASREGLMVRGYEPSFDEQARMEELHRADAAQRDRKVAEKPAPTVEPVAPTAAVGATEATVLAPSADAEKNGAPQPLPSGSSTELSDADKRLLLTVSVHTQDRKALYAAVSEDMDPLRREVQAERIDLNRDALNGALERALESPTLVSAFSRSGYEPDGLRQMARDGAWDSEVADAVYIVRSGLNRHEVALEAGANVPLGGALAATPEDRLAGEATAAPERQPEQEPHIVREERLHQAAPERRHENDELAELFLHGGAERIAAEPRLANALQAQAAMDQHLGAAFDGDAERMTSASLESRHMISDVLRRGLDVSVREPTPVRLVEPIRPTHDLER